VDEDGYPSTCEGFKKIEPIIEYMEGWKENLGDVSSISDLPDQAKAYLKKIESSVGVPVGMVQLGSRETVMTDRDLIV
jgi:adenylosuccinate synthase